MTDNLGGWLNSALGSLKDQSLKRLNSVKETGMSGINYLDNKLEALDNQIEEKFLNEK